MLCEIPYVKKQNVSFSFLADELKGLYTLSNFETVSPSTLTLTKNDVMGKFDKPLEGGIEVASNTKLYKGRHVSKPL